MSDNIRYSKFINEKALLLFGEANLFIYFLIPWIIFKSKYIFYLLILAYLFSIFLRFTDNDLIGFMKKVRFLITGGFKGKSAKKRY